MPNSSEPKGLAPKPGVVPPTPSVVAPAQSDARLVSPKLAPSASESGPASPKLAHQASEGGCDRGGAEMFRMHAVWRCPCCGFKTDCCGW